MAKLSTYSDDKFNGIINRIAEGESVKSACDNEGVAKSVLFLWMTDEGLNEHRDLWGAYKKALIFRTLMQVDEIVAIADDDAEDFEMIDGRLRFNGKAIGRSKLRIDARMWLAERLMGETYGKGGTNGVGQGAGRSDGQGAVAFTVNETLALGYVPSPA